MRWREQDGHRIWEFGQTRICCARCQRLPSAPGDNRPNPVYLPFIVLCEGLLCNHCFRECVDTMLAEQRLLMSGRTEREVSVDFANWARESARKHMDSQLHPEEGPAK